MNIRLQIIFAALFAIAAWRKGMLHDADMEFLLLMGVAAVWRIFDREEASRKLEEQEQPQ